MFDDARALPADAALEYDLCIIGAGPAGLAVAASFLGTGVRVCVLESGGLRPEGASQALLHGENVGRRNLPLHWTRQSRFGGTTGWWGGECRPFDDDADLRPRPWLGHDGWPVAADELAAFEPAACGFCGLGENPFVAQNPVPPGVSLPLDPDRFSTCLFRYADPLDLGQRHRPALQSASNILILLHATAIRIEASDDRRLATAIHVAAGPSRQLRVHARRFVLAAGGIENARLLLASQELGNGSGQVGRCFMDHLYLDDIATLVPSPKAPSFRPFLRRMRGAAGQFKAAIAPSAQLMAATGIAHCCFKLASPIKREPAMLAAFALRHGLASGYFPEPARILLGRVARHAPRLAAELARFARHGEGGEASQGRALSLGMVLEQVPNPDSRVTLGSTLDQFGRPTARLDWRLVETDRTGWRVALAELRRDLERTRLGRLEPLAEPLLDQAWERARPACHHMGTTRMSAGPSAGVVDRHGRVHELANLYVAGSSVFPTGGHANPVLMTVTLALRLARHLRAGTP